MKNDALLLTAISDVLVAHWDPLGIKFIKEAAGEYDNYARELADMISSGPRTVEDIEKYLVQVEMKQIGLPGWDLGRARIAAEKIEKLSR